MTTFLFPGQGSQTEGMGKELFIHFPIEVADADAILGYSIEQLCTVDTQQPLENTAFTQPALYVVEALSFLIKRSEGLEPTFCIGHSLGEYSALFAAGAFNFATGLKLVQKRGELMAKAQGGGMLAVINLSADSIQTLLEIHAIRSIDFANFNSSKQIVLSGPATDISKANDILSKEAMLCIPLNVSGAFHSRYMQSAAEEFGQFIAPFKFSPLQTPVIANVSAEPYSDSDIKENLVRQITQPVRWTDTIHYLKARGETAFVEVGPGNVLTRLVAQN